MPLPKEEYFTYADYLTWSDDVRYELVEGAPYMMSPGPNRIHQKISGLLLRQLGNYLEGKSCEVYAAPFDVRLNANEEDDTVVQPDILVVCDPSKLDDKACVGAPDLIAEILSSSTYRHDRTTKFRLYEKYGVKEYWIVNPDTATVEKYVLKNGQYVRSFDDDEYRVRVEVLDDCIVDFTSVFKPDETR
ncbi:hypothetical protein AGMMS49983_00550 [Clostridia bacterium]|nr:hypothetical protein AGMMS49983_00550 [Clostridia bacterium]